MGEFSFDKYLGQKVLVNESVRFYTDRHGQEKKYNTYAISNEDTVIPKIETEYSNVRVFLPGTIGTLNFDPTRLNVYIEKQTDGSFEITKVNFG